MTTTTPSTDAEEVIGPPAKFSAEPVRKKSNRWMWVLIGIFVAILAAVAIGTQQVKSYMARSAEERQAKAKKDAEQSEPERKRRLFDLDLPPSNGKLPDAFNNAPTAVTPPVVPPISGGYESTSTQPSVTPQAAPKAPRRSVIVQSSDQAKAASQEEAAPTAAQPKPAQSAATGPDNKRPRSVQEFAKSTQQQAITRTPQANATPLGDRDFLLARGSSIPCTLYYQLNSNVPGPTKCIVSEDIYSDNGKVLLIEKGSGVDGVYGSSSLKPGDQRLAVAWERIKTPNGVVIDIDSIASDSTGTVGVSGDIDNHWGQRIGAAVLLSLIDDAIQIQTAKEGAQSAGAMGSSQPYQSTTTTSKSIAEKVLDSTINIAPTLRKNRGERIMVLVRKDLWFDSIYKLK